MDDEVRVIANLLIGFVRRVEFGRDFEQQLSFYVEARASFSNIDAVVVFLVQVAIICSRDVTSRVSSSFSMHRDCVNCFYVTSVSTNLRWTLEKL